MYVHGGIRIHALRELNLTRNLEYVLWGARILPCLCRQTLSVVASGQGDHSPGFWHFSRHLISYPGRVYKALSCVIFQACRGQKAILAAEAES
jgi:hypothetical protein